MYLETLVTFVIFIEDPDAFDIFRFMHKTKTIDYIIILSGEIYLILDETETLLKAGDVVIQRGTEHAWSNRSKTICRAIAVLIDAKTD